MPLFLNAVPIMTGTMSRLMVASRMIWRIISSLDRLVFQQAGSISSSLNMLRASSISWRAASAASRNSAGIVRGRTSSPFSPSKVMAFMVTRSMTPVKSSPAPMLSWSGTALRPSFSRRSWHDAGGIGAGAVHLVDEGDAGNAVAFHLAVDGERLALHAADGAEDHDRPVQHAQRAFDLDGEVDVAGGVDQVDDVVVPLDLGGGGGDGDAALALQVHVVHRGPAVAAFDLLHAVDAAGVIQEIAR